MSLAEEVQAARREGSRGDTSQALVPFSAGCELPSSRASQNSDSMTLYLRDSRYVLLKPSAEHHLYQCL